MSAMTISFWRPLWLRPTVFAAMLAAFLLGYCAASGEQRPHLSPEILR
jgi:hypothetical protein